ncbi:MAG TPA: thioesterase domain-containing protein, partial [Pseudonocardia sp.]|nr:thioesterase domain-containing protein [Pseudonocardia sp.]
PLFCVHPVSGLALAYSGLLGQLPDRPVYGLQARSLTSDTELPADLTEMAAQYVARLLEVAPEGPYHLLGWSLGGSVAHLMAGQLAAAGQRVDTLALLDSVPATMLGGADPDWTLERGLAQLLLVSGYPVTGAELAAEAALAQIGGRDGPLAGFTADDLCNVALSWRHSAGLRAPAAPAPHPGELLLFEATRDVPAERPDLARLWAPHVSGPVRVYPVAATHWEMAGPGPLAEVAARLR